MKTRNKVNIIWLSANILGYELLKEACNIKKDSIVAIITLSERAKTKMYDGINNSQWKEFGLPVYEIKDINKEINLLRSLEPDYIIMTGWRQLVDEKILNLPKKGFIGFHPSLLPKGRGPAPIINSILCGLKKSGVTIFYLDKGIDSGDIIGQVEFSIKESDYAKDVYLKVIKGGRKLIKKFLPCLLENKSPRAPQDNKKASYFPKRSLKDNEINIKKDSPQEIYRKIRAFSKPYKGAFIKLSNKKLIVWRAELKKEKSV